MSYIAEQLNSLSTADLRAWALSQVSSGHIHDRIAEAEALIRWIHSDTQSVDRGSGGIFFDHSDGLVNPVSQEARSVNGHSEVSNRHRDHALPAGFPGSDGCINDSPVVTEGYDIIDEKSGRIVGFQSCDPIRYRFQKSVRTFAHKDSSSGCADGESAGELPTPSRTDDALPLKYPASANVFPSSEKGERL